LTAPWDDEVQGPWGNEVQAATALLRCFTNKTTRFGLADEVQVANRGASLLVIPFELQGPSEDKGNIREASSLAIPIEPQGPSEGEVQVANKEASLSVPSLTVMRGSTNSRTSTTTTFRDQSSHLHDQGDLSRRLDHQAHEAALDETSFLPTQPSVRWQLDVSVDIGSRFASPLRGRAALKLGRQKNEISSRQQYNKAQRSTISCLFVESA
jgi:hypothetical protein